MHKDVKIKAAALLVVSAGLAIASLVNHVKEKRDNEKRTEEVRNSDIAFTHYTDELDALTDELDRKIRIARQALSDDDFNQIIKDY